MYNRSFIKWVGGKYRSLAQILPKLPKDFKTYYEPFMGSGVVFFNINPHQAILNDLEYSLVSTFRSVKRECERVQEYLDGLSNDSDTYYSVRCSFNNDADVFPGKKAAQFIYMNKCGFNGLYRVNKAGVMNVAFGKRTGDPHKDFGVLESCSEMLQRARVMSGDYKDVLDLTRNRDFVYMDPPYYKEFPTSFAGYNSKQFAEEDHERLALECKFLTSKGVLFALSNSDTSFIRNLYKNYNIYPIYTTRTVSRDPAVRGTVCEVLITNYSASNNAIS